MARGRLSVKMPHVKISHVKILLVKIPTEKPEGQNTMLDRP